jgi:hypothetical protein
MIDISTLMDLVIEDVLAHPGPPPKPVEGWVMATDPIVETWIGKRVEISTEAGASASGELLGVDETDLHMDLRPKYPEPQEIIRSNWRVRLTAEVSR